MRKMQALNSCATQIFRTLTKLTELDWPSLKTNGLTCHCQHEIKIKLQKYVAWHFYATHCCMCNPKLFGILTLYVHYAHVTDNLKWGYSNYTKVAPVHYFSIIALQTPQQCLRDRERHVGLIHARVGLILFATQAILFCRVIFNVLNLVKVLFIT